MTGDILTVAWKEWQELRDQLLRIRRGGLSAIIVVIMLGIFMPLQLGPLWIESSLMLGYWPLLSSGMVSTLIADAFAGERERHTLESLLATRLPDAAILIGKVIAAVLYGLLFTMANVLVGYVVLLIRYWNESWLVFPLTQLALIVALVTLACATIAGVGVFVSLKAATVRQAQQTLGVIMLVLFIAPFLILPLLGGDIRGRLTRVAMVGAESLALWAILVLAVAAVILNGLALARFKRGKLTLD
ncbi:MAG TPA: ABC transporter permease subunit [Gemmatimonadaceae bacterium]